MWVIDTTSITLTSIPLVLRLSTQRPLYFLLWHWVFELKVKLACVESSNMNVILGFIVESAFIMFLWPGVYISFYRWNTRYKLPRVSWDQRTVLEGQNILDAINISTGQFCTWSLHLSEHFPPLLNLRPHLPPIQTNTYSAGLK